MLALHFFSITSTNRDLSLSRLKEKYRKDVWLFFVDVVDKWTKSWFVFYSMIDMYLNVYTCQQTPKSALILLPSCFRFFLDSFRRWLWDSNCLAQIWWVGPLLLLLFIFWAINLETYKTKKEILNFTFLFIFIFPNIKASGYVV